jgi:hypothetical protein
MTDLMAFEQALKRTKGSGRTLLMDNGFSIAQTSGSFSY